MTSFINKTLPAKDRRLHLLILSIFLLGPMITLPGLKWDSLDFLSLVFPVTVDSLTLGNREFQVLEILWFLFVLKVLVLGIILWVRLFRNKPIGKSLIRFYILVFLICIGKLTMSSMYFSDNASRLVLVIGPIMFFGWCLSTGVLIQRHWAFLREASAPG